MPRVACLRKEDDKREREMNSFGQEKEELGVELWCTELRVRINVRQLPSE